MFIDVLRLPEMLRGLWERFHREPWNFATKIDSDADVPMETSQSNDYSRGKAPNFEHFESLTLIVSCYRSRRIARDLKFKLSEM